MSPSPLVRRLSAALAATTLAAAPAAAPAAPAPRTYLLASVHAATLERAREGAVRKLETPECRRVLEDFRDEEGRRLTDNLAKWDRSPADYLRMIPFLDGASHPLCRGGRAELFTVMGTPRVFVCRSFAERQVREPWTAENMVIHEMLHTLGLGENPPSSAEITRRVNDRCQ